MAGTVISGRSTALKIQPTEEASELIMVDGFISSSVASVVTPNTQTLASYSGLNMDLVDILSKYDWDVDLMSEIFYCESGHNPFAINYTDQHRGCTGSFGIAQIGCFWADKYGYTYEDLLIPEVNIHIAYLIYKENRLIPWSCYNKVKNA